VILILGYELISLILNLAFYRKDGDTRKRFSIIIKTLGKFCKKMVNLGYDLIMSMPYLAFKKDADTRQ
jgi:hypothetical protein